MKRITPIVALFAVLAAGQVSQAKTLTSVSYAYERVFPTAVRFLRIDERLKIIEKDADAGYVIFELVDDGLTFQGSFEIARIRDDEGREASRLIVRITDRPDYMEQGLIDRFKLKLRQELGDPQDPPPPPKKKKAKQKKVAKASY